MAEYIERDAVLSLAKDICVLTKWDSEYRHRSIDPGDVREIPAADVAPVRHGRWVKTIGENGVTSACSCNLCGFEDNRYSLFNYCPNCGAHMMDGGESDER